MLLVLVLTLMLPTSTQWVTSQVGDLTLWPLTMVAVTVLLGPVGAVFALRRARYGWAVLSALWGPVLVCALFVVVTIVWGP